MKNQKLVIAFLILSFALAAPAILAGDVIDFLPEVQVARSLVPAFANAFVFEGACIDVQLDAEIPNNLLFDDNGQPRSFDEMGMIMLQLNCIYQSLALEDPDNALQNVPFFLEALAGNMVVFPNGTELDGTKQAVRASLLFSHLLLFQFDLTGQFEIGILGSDPCGQLREWVLSDTSLELQFVAFLTLASEIVVSDEEELPIQCSTPVAGTESELIEAAESGDLDAALELSVLWVLQLMNEFGEEPTVDDLPGMLAELDRFELFVLQNTMKFPLLTLAATVPLANLYLFEYELMNQ